MEKFPASSCKVLDHSRVIDHVSRFRCEHRRFLLVLFCYYRKSIEYQRRNILPCYFRHKYFPKVLYSGSIVERVQRTYLSLWLISENLVLYWGHLDIYFPTGWQSLHRAIHGRHVGYHVQTHALKCLVLNIFRQRFTEMPTKGFLVLFKLETLYHNSNLLLDDLD